MPTYRNDSQNTYTVVNAAGNRVQVLPGGTVETLSIYNETNLTKTADTPRYNPTISEEDVIATAQEITIDADTNTIIVINDSDDVSVDVSWGAVANTPATPIPASSRWDFPNIKGMTDKLIFVFSGSIAAGKFRVIQMR